MKHNTADVQRVAAALREAASVDGVSRACVADCLDELVAWRNLAAAAGTPAPVATPDAKLIWVKEITLDGYQTAVAQGNALLVKAHADVQAAQRRNTELETELERKTADGLLLQRDVHSANAHVRSLQASRDGQAKTIAQQDARLLELQATRHGEADRATAVVQSLQAEVTALRERFCNPLGPDAHVGLALTPLELKLTQDLAEQRDCTARGLAAQARLVNQLADARARGEQLADDLQKQRAYQTQLQSQNDTLHSNLAGARINSETLERELAELRTRFKNQRKLIGDVQQLVQGH